MFKAEFILNNRYQLKTCLSENLSRQTWVGQDLELNEPVIVKMLGFGGGMAWEDLKLFEREVETLKQLNHPQIPKYRDYFSWEETVPWLVLVQDYIPGDSLKNLLEKRVQFSEAEVRTIALKVLDILIYLHELNPPVLHRDIKPSNLILGAEVFLVDFGAVQTQRRVSGSTFTVVGTYGYAPVEQYGGQAEPASDLYALGATLIHLLTGTAPADLPFKDLRIQVRECVKKDVSIYFLQWLERMTEPSLEKRFTSALQARDAIMGGLGLATENEIEPTPNTTRIILNQSEDKLEISIPAPIEIDLLKPMQMLWNNAGDFFKSRYQLFIQNLNNSENLSNSPGLVRVAFIGGALMLIGITLPALFAIIPFFGVFSFVVTCLIAGNLLGRSRSYFERIYLSIDGEQFVLEYQEIWSLNNRQITGQISELVKIEISPFYETEGLKNKPARLAVVLNIQRLPGMLETYGFGQELSQGELNWLKQMITEQLKNFRV